MNRALLIVALTQSKWVEDVLPPECRVIGTKANICEGNETWLLEGPMLPATPQPATAEPWLIGIESTSEIIEGSRLRRKVWFTHAPLTVWERIFPSPQAYLDDLASLTHGTGRASAT